MSSDAEAMANAPPALTWKDALRILDENFNFKRRTGHIGESYAYRIDENTPSLLVRLHKGEITVQRLDAESKTGLSNVREKTAIQHVKTQDELIECIRTFRKIVIIPNSKIPTMPDKTESDSTMSIPLNTILYGPPGTGKTFRTAELAVQICDGKSPMAREEIMTRYEELRKDGRINFVTFHQSYGYEDFVEGLKPESFDGQITYPVRPGVFRRICEAARRGAVGKPGLKGKSLKERTIFKMSLGAVGTTVGNLTFDECIENDYVLLGWGDHVDFSGCDSAKQINEKLEQDHPSAERPDSQARYIDVFKNEMKIGDIVIVSQGNRAFRAIGEVVGEYEYLEEAAAGGFHQMRPVRWLAVFESNQDVHQIFDRNFMMSSLYRMDHGGLRLDVLEELIRNQAVAGSQNFVLIVDEINRANISKAFGELITLLEPDKRDGMVNALTVKLPYSGDDFTVPSNLYIVGTMNTADRSIALLDTALRRRFEFEEIQPDYFALPAFPIDEVNLRALLQALNERIEYLFDRDHTIGHAYLMHVRSLADLDAVFRRKILPLLQEYFYEDWSKVQAVLNDRAGLFIEMKEGVPKGLDVDLGGYESRPRYKIRAEQFPLNAYINIYQ